MKHNFDYNIQNFSEGRKLVNLFLYFNNSINQIKIGLVIDCKSQE